MDSEKKLISTEYEVWDFQLAGGVKRHALTRIEKYEVTPTVIHTDYKIVAETTSEAATVAAQRLFYGLPQAQNPQG